MTIYEECKLTTSKTCLSTKAFQSHCFSFTDAPIPPISLLPECRSCSESIMVLKKIKYSSFGDAHYCSGTKGLGTPLGARFSYFFFVITFWWCRW